MNNRRKIQYSLLSLLGIGLISAMVFWKAARDEVYYLCGNFSEGVVQSSVIRQLDTATFSSYQKKNTNTGLSIVFSSKLNFHYYQCTIELDKENTVVGAVFM